MLSAEYVCQRSTTVSSAGATYVSASRVCRFCHPPQRGAKRNRELDITGPMAPNHNLPPEIACEQHTNVQKNGRFIESAVERNYLGPTSIHSQVGGSYPGRLH